MTRATELQRALARTVLLERLMVQDPAVSPSVISLVFSIKQALERLLAKEGK